jgi:hypothetical protein
MHVLALDLIAEERIRDAIRAGAFDDLPGAGRPLNFDDDKLIPEDLRVAYRILKNAGYVPPEVEARKEAASLRALIAAAGDDASRRRALAKLALIEARLDANCATRSRAADYVPLILQRFERA